MLLAVVRYTTLFEQLAAVTEQLSWVQRYYLTEKDTINLDLCQESWYAKTSAL